MNPRRRGRELALQALCQYDVQGDAFEAELDAFLTQSHHAEARQFARSLARGAWARHRESDALLDQLTERWSVERMAATDRNILRMGIYQLTCCPDIPPRVVINEAIELGKRYSTADSGHFINGLLDAARRRLAAEVK
ncbi:MAG: Transcription antitermination protein NusB [Phycisphaerae bacterium]|nr:Transcription antitermination protein NusB [Phycisphaerae bacterium]